MTEVTLKPIRRINETLSKQADVKAKVTCMRVDGFFLFRKQIEEQRTNADFANRARPELITPAVTAATRTMSKQNHTFRAGGNTQVAVEDYFARSNFDIVSGGRCGLFTMTHIYTLAVFLVSHSVITPH